MSKTRRQRALEHPGLPKKGVRDKRRIAKQPCVDSANKDPAAVELGRKGGLAPHGTRGFQTLDGSERKRISNLGVEARKRRQAELGDLREAV